MTCVLHYGLQLHLQPTTIATATDDRPEPSPASVMEKRAREPAIKEEEEERKRRRQMREEMIVNGRIERTAAREAYVRGARNALCWPRATASTHTGTRRTLMGTWPGSSKPYPAISDLAPLASRFQAPVFTLAYISVFCKSSPHTSPSTVAVPT